MSDFIAFDAAYSKILLPDNPNRYNELAAETHFNVFNSPIWEGSGQLFANAIVQECIDNLHLNGYDDAANQLIKHSQILCNKTTNS